MAETRIENLFEQMGAGPAGEGSPSLEEIARWLLEQGVKDPMRARIEYGECGSHDLWVTYDNDRYREQIAVEMTLPARMNLDDVRAVFPDRVFPATPSVPHPFVPAPEDQR